MEKKSIKDIECVVSQHGCGKKKVLLSAEETTSNITQVAVIYLDAGEEGQEHMHWKIEEGFYVLKGELELILDGKSICMLKGDYMHLPMAAKHNLKAITDVELLTIGCKIDV